MMKRIFSIVLCLVLCAACAVAETKTTFDLGADGTTETLQLTADSNGKDTVYELEIRTADGDMLDAVNMTVVPEQDWAKEAGVLFRVAQLPDSRIYTETLYLYEGVSVIYCVYEWDGEMLHTVAELSDPGYSDAKAILDAETGDVLYDWESDGTVTGIYDSRSAALNGELGEYGLTFETQTVAMDAFGSTHECEVDIAVLTDQMLLCAQKTDLVDQPLITFAPVDTSAVEENVAVEEVKETTVHMTGDVYVRTGAGREFDALGVVKDGSTLEYLKEQRDDERPVTWYKVNYKGQEGWVSSMYSYID